MDYTSNPINATFAAGSASVTVNVLVTKDTIVEPSEAFDLTFNIPSSLNSRVLPGTLTEADGIIIDSTGKILCQKLIIKEYDAYV